MPRRALALVLVASLVTAACGGDGRSDDDAASPAATTEATEAPAPPETTASTTTTTEPRPQPDLDQKPDVATDAAGLAAQVVETDRTFLDPDSTEVEVAAAGHLQQRVFRYLTERPELDGPVADELPTELREVVAGHVHAGRRLLDTIRPGSTLPAWTIVEPAPADELRGYYAEGEATDGVPWQYLAGVHLVETRMGRLRGVSTANARGPMQFIPGTWAAFGEGDIEDDRDAIMAAARYLAHNGGDCREGAPCNLRNALFRYNPTDKYVDAVTVYAERMRADERYHLGYHHWQVYYWTTAGDVWLRVGYSRDEPRPVTDADVADGARD